jgi:DNA-binding XRE family transcriptional regulator
MAPAARADVRARGDKMIREMTLQELREARRLTQENLAKVLGVKQASVSKIEKRTDMYLSTLRSFVQAMGGDLMLVAHFPDGDVRLKQLEDMDNDEAIVERRIAR